jgi:hypothetical protein
VFEINWRVEVTGERTKFQERNVNGIAVFQFGGDLRHVQLQYSPSQTGLPPDVELAIALTPAEARAFADVLSRKADEAEVSAQRRRNQER